MKYCKILVIILILFSFVHRVGAQVLKENEVVVIQGEKYVLHQVRTGETIYSIGKKFRVDSLVLARHNPQLSEGLKIGDILKIPYQPDIDLQEPPVFKKGDPSGFFFHTIASRTETPYFIAKKYGITVEELYAYNPEVNRFRKGTKIRIPRWDSPDISPDGTVAQRDGTSQEGETHELIRHEVKKGETLFSLSRQYKISESEILFYNPGARELKTGSIIYLPRPVDSTTKELSEERSTTEKVEDARVYEDLYFFHTIVSGETLWGISRRYNVSEEDLITLNPFLESEFPAGVSIRVPAKKSETAKVVPVNEDAFINHVVQPGETLYGLASRYNITIPDIKRFNPVLEQRNLVSGETILIPRKPDEEIVSFMEEISDDSVRIEKPLFESEYYEIKVPDHIPENCRKTDEMFYSGEIFKVALFLPLFVEENDNLNSEIILPEADIDTLKQEIDIESDTIIEREFRREKFHGFYRDSENFIQFYEGVLLAVDSLRRTGMKIELDVYDTKRSTFTVRNHIHTAGFLETDLIIGPVYPQTQAEVSAFASKNRIPMISPLSSQSDHLDSNPYFYQVNPTRDFLLRKTAELVTEEFFNSNFIVFNIGNRQNNFAEQVPALIREKLLNSGYWGQPDGFSFNVYNFESEGPFGFSRILSGDKENVIFIPSQNEGDISVALSNIDNLSKDYSITLIGFNWYQQYKSIDLDLYHNLKLHYIAPYWIDYGSRETVRFFEKFKDNFYTEPNNFGIQGYDVTFFFLNALKLYGKDFNECLPYMPANLVQGDYRFEKVSRFGGFMNQGASVILYEKDYDVVRKRIIGRQNLAQRW